MTESVSQKMHKRDAKATAERMILAAQLIFSNKSYDAAGTREIAEAADVNVALINRYFGSKEGLFAAAVPPSLNIDALLDGPFENFGERVATAFSAKPAPNEQIYDPVIAFLRSAMNFEAAPSLRKALQDQIVGPVEARLEGKDAQARAVLIVALLVGYDLITRVLKLNENSGHSQSEQLRLLADLLDVLSQHKKT